MNGTFGLSWHYRGGNAIKGGDDYEAFIDGCHGRIEALNTLKEKAQKGGLEPLKSGRAW